LKSSLTVAGFACVLSACATSQPDHFYVLSAEPQDTSAARTAPTMQATLKVTLPSLVDRPEMVLNTSLDGVIALEHERWAAPLTDLVTQTLARDLERRRGELLMTGQGVSLAGTTARIAVDIVDVTVRRGQRASIEARWRIFDVRTGKDVVGGDAFSAPLSEDGYANVARALSVCLGLLADRLAVILPRAE
jgi:uncharacterized lipoprotein YmbA